jgi:hypothetical protein
MLWERGQAEAPALQIECSSSKNARKMLTNSCCNCACCHTDGIGDMVTMLLEILQAQSPPQ